MDFSWGSSFFFFFSEPQWFAYLFTEPRGERGLLTQSENHFSCLACHPLHGPFRSYTLPASSICGEACVTECGQESLPCTEAWGRIVLVDDVLTGFEDFQNKNRRWGDRGFRLGPMCWVPRLHLEDNTNSLPALPISLQIGRCSCCLSLYEEHMFSRSSG